MAILNICEFIERVESEMVYCPHCRGIMRQISFKRMDALKFVLGKKTLPKRFQCADCQRETTRQD